MGPLAPAAPPRQRNGQVVRSKKTVFKLRQKSNFCRIKKILSPLYLVTGSYFIISDTKLNFLDFLIFSKIFFLLKKFSNILKHLEKNYVQYLIR